MNARKCIIPVIVMKIAPWDFNGVDMSVIHVQMQLIGSDSHQFLWGVYLGYATLYLIKATSFLVPNSWKIGTHGEPNFQELDDALQMPMFSTSILLVGSCIMKMITIDFTIQSFTVSYSLRRLWARIIYIMEVLSYRMAWWNME